MAGVTQLTYLYRHPDSSFVAKRDAFVENMLMSWKQWLGFSSKDDSAHLLYRSLVTQARSPQFYLNVGVPDTLDGRFDMIVLHMFLVIDRLSPEGASAKDLRQRLFDVMFDDMDQALREIGVGDLSVGKKVKKMAQAFYGRLGAYDEGLRADDEAVFEDALKRNIFPDIEVAPAQIKMLATYARSTRDILGGLSLERLSRGEAVFSPAPEVFPEVEAAS